MFPLAIVTCLSFHYYVSVGGSIMFAGSFVMRKLLLSPEWRNQHPMYRCQNHAAGMIMESIFTLNQNEIPWPGDLVVEQESLSISYDYPK